jgi:hypothetical protein
MERESKGINIIINIHSRAKKDGAKKDGKRVGGKTDAGKGKAKK